MVDEDLYRKYQHIYNIKIHLGNMVHIVCHNFCFIDVVIHIYIKLVGIQNARLRIKLVRIIVFHGGGTFEINI